MNTNKDTRLAVLIDADNISAYYVEGLMEEIARFGVPTIKRIYGDWTKPQLSAWKACLLDYAIAPIQQFGYTTGKNATDSALIIDAMDILYSEKVDGFCLVSSDSDFTRLATRLREAGKIVYGIGESKTPNAFIVACDRFIFLEILKSTDMQNQMTTQSPATVVKTVTSSILKIDQKVKHFIYDSIEAVADEDGWAFLADVGNLMFKKQPSFDPRNYGYNKLSTLIRSMKNLEIDERPTSSPRVRHIYIRIMDN